MAVQPSVSYSQSPDGKTLTIIDTSDYTSGTIADYTRVAEIWSSINGSGSLLYTLPFTGTNLTVEQQITEDQYISIKLIFTGSPTVATVYANATTQQFEQNAINDLLNQNCGCKKESGCDKTFQGFIYMYNAQVATSAGNSGLANTFIKSSLKWLTS